MTVTDLAIYVSAAGFWLGLAALALLKRSMDKTMEGILLELEEEHGQRTAWGWLTANDGNGQPMRVPEDLVHRAVEVLGRETQEDRDRMEADQWMWNVTPMGIRHAMMIAQREPDIETALMQWAGTMGLPDD